MAAIALNKFRTIRAGITTNLVGIYTCPIGVAAIVTLSKVVNTSTGIGASTYTVSAYHSRNTESPSDYDLANAVPVPPNDSFSIVSDGRLALETNDVIKIQANANGVLNIILSVLETAKQ